MKSKHYKIIFFIYILFSFSFYSGCGNQSKDIEDYGNLYAIQGGLKISDVDRHTGGYGRTQCLVCHNAAVGIHRSPDSLINIDTMNETIRRNNGEGSYCMTCHGSNGASAEELK